MKPPNKLKATIGDMLEWASNWNGKTTAKRQALISPILDIRYSSGNSLQKPHIKVIGES